MKRPPYLIRMHINRDGRKINLWLPLFIILPVIFILLLIFLPLILIASALLWYAGWGRPLLIIIPTAIGCLCALRGLEVDVKQNTERVFISVK